MDHAYYHSINIELRPIDGGDSVELSVIVELATAELSDLFVNEGSGPIAEDIIECSNLHDRYVLSGTEIKIISHEEVAKLRDEGKLVKLHYFNNDENPVDYQDKFFLYEDATEEEITGDHE